MWCWKTTEWLSGKREIVISCILYSEYRANIQEIAAVAASLYSLLTIPGQRKIKTAVKKVATSTIMEINISVIATRFNRFDSGLLAGVVQTSTTTTSINPNTTIAGYRNHGHLLDSMVFNYSVDYIYS